MLRALVNWADEKNPLFVRRKAPYNQGIEQTPRGAPFSAALSAWKEIQK
jgi:hypothetical protein